MIDIVYAIDGPPPEEEMCVIGLDICTDDVPCPVHAHWKVIKENIRTLLGDENLENLSIEMANKRKKLKG